MIILPLVRARACASLTDCAKLVASQLGTHKAIVIYGYDYPGWPMDPAIEAFETLATKE